MATFYATCAPGPEFTVKAVPVKELGEINEYAVGIIMGATAMEE
jgi:hypothetical protein